MADIPVYRRLWTLDVDGNYILNTAIPDSDRRQTVSINGTRVLAYDGSILVKQRPRGSTGAWKTMAYTILSTGAKSAAALGAADFEIEVDSSGREIALDSSAGTRAVGSITLNITDTPEQ